MTGLDTLMSMATLTGHGFSLSERTAIHAASPILLTETKQSRVKVWGKVYGCTNDYIVLQCIGQGALSTCLTFFSVDGGVNYSMLESLAYADPKVAVLSRLTGQYMGDPAYEYRLGSGADLQTFKESQRLAAFIAQHDHNCRVIPRGSQLLYEDDSVRLNALFEGLDRTAAGKLGSYLHLRWQRREASRLEKEGVDGSVDFLDPLTVDIPKGTWALKYDPLRDVVFGSSNAFVGAVFYHQPETRIYGNIYMGDGSYNHDVVFML